MLKKATSGVLVLTYWKYALHVKRAVALLYSSFDHSPSLLILQIFSGIYGLFSRNIQQTLCLFREDLC